MSFTDKYKSFLSEVSNILSGEKSPTSRNFKLYLAVFSADEDDGDVKKHEDLLRNILSTEGFTLPSEGDSGEYDNDDWIKGNLVIQCGEEFSGKSASINVSNVFSIIDTKRENAIQDFRDMGTEDDDILNIATENNNHDILRPYYFESNLITVLSLVASQHQQNIFNRRRMYIRDLLKEERSNDAITAAVAPMMSTFASMMGLNVPQQDIEDNIPKVKSVIGNLAARPEV